MLTDYVAFDLETTGLRPTLDRILEIGAVRVEDGEVTGTYETLIDHGLPIPREITALTGITEEMTQGAPDLRTAVRGFLEFSGDAVLLGHNILFDYGFMKRNVVNLQQQAAAGMRGEHRAEMPMAAGTRTDQAKQLRAAGMPAVQAEQLKAAGMREPQAESRRRETGYERMGVDTLTIARAVLRPQPTRSLDHRAVWYNIPAEHPHRAMDDALTTARLYERLREEFGDSHPELFEPVQLQFQVRKESPITNSQKVYLRDLIKYHRIDANVNVDMLTKNEASRMIDKIILQYGKPGASGRRSG
ncbi:MAG: 3'-5' exonuclease [Lachnospiraceae bacterium]|nr:3'-5' exonuclease [Lachnospiraceae bacterium]